MPKQNNIIWRFFASVKLALFILIILAVVSIIGTFIKQGQPASFYIEQYGAGTASVMEAIQLTNMYSSPWYVALLGLFAVNLLVCSIERLPGVWEIVRKDNLNPPPRDLAKMSCHRQIQVKLDSGKTIEEIKKTFAANGWKSSRQTKINESTMLCYQKGAWSRLGVYIVHLSILVVLAGAILGSLFGFQAYVFLPEGRTTDHIFLRHTKEPYPLGFQLRCDRFEKTFYPSGMVKEYRSDLTVLDPERETPYQKSIIVNDPLSYKGLTFYQGDSYPTEEFFVHIQDLTSGAQQAFRVPPERDVDWAGTPLTFSIDELQLGEDGSAERARIKLAGPDDTSAVWVDDEGTAQLRHGDRSYSLSFRQYHSTLLLITKDPGVTVVYAGCILLVIGLMVSLLFSHRRIWIQIEEAGRQKSVVLTGGNTNKNKAGFEQSFIRLTEQIEEACKV